LTHIHHSWCSASQSRLRSSPTVHARPVSCQPLRSHSVYHRCVPCRCSSTGVCSSFLSLKNPHNPCVSVPTTFSFSLILTGFGNRCLLKFFSITDSVCLGRRPVARTAESPRLILLSFLHLAGDVENPAAGALRVHFAEGTRKARTVSGRGDSAGRKNRRGVVAAIAIPCCALEQVSRAEQSKSVDAHSSTMR
jgi:hypothetical protein